VEKLLQNPKALCAGTSEIYVYFKHDIHKMYKSGPYSPTHATAGTFAFRRALLEQSRYDDNASLAEEKDFLKNYTVPFVQLDPFKTILVFSHNHNSFDKRRLLENPHPDYMRECDKTVDDFIRKSYEAKIRRFFMEEIDDSLSSYPDGKPAMKHDVIQQMVEIEKTRQEKLAESAKPKLIMRRGDGKEVELGPTEMIALIQQQHQNIITLNARVKELEEMVKQQQQQQQKQTKSDKPSLLNQPVFKVNGD
jgi:hypothetical protein